MKLSTKLIGIISLIALTMSANTVSAKGGELKFHSVVVAVSQTAGDAGSVTATIHGADVPIIVNGDTEIVESGEEIGLGDVSAGDFIKVNSFFSDEGLVADEIEILDVRQEQFRFRGAISAVDNVAEDTVITLLGTDVTITSDTDITRRGSGNGNDVPATDLLAGDLVNVSGVVDDGLLVATRIHVGSREQGNIELEGEIVTASDTEITLSIEGGVELIIVIDDDTSIVGELVQGVFVEVEGQLLEDLSLIAFEIVADDDGDGDADDDNDRGKKGDKHSNNGRGNGNGNGNDNDDDDDDDDSDSAGDVIEVGAETILAAEGEEISGKAEFSYVEEADEVEQELEVEIEHAAPETEYSLLVFFGDQAVEFGTFTSDALGEFKAEFKNEESDDEATLADLLPEGSDVRDITGVQILQDGNVILEGDF